MTTLPPGDDISLVDLDATGANPHQRYERYRQAGRVIRTRLPGLPDDVHAWMVTRHRDLDQLLHHPGVSRNWRNWHAYQQGRVPPDWPLRGMFMVDNMFTTDGDEHQRLRKQLTKTFTPRRVEAMTPDITRIVNDVLDQLEALFATNGVVDLRAHFAYPIPMQVICTLLGIPEDRWSRLRTLVDVLLRTSNKNPASAEAFERDRLALLEWLIDLRRSEAGPDLTSALIAEWDRTENRDLTHQQLVDTLWMLVVAGHETTLSLLCNGVIALLTHPAQRAAVTAAGGPDWSHAVEEILRWDGPVDHLVSGYTTTDIDVAGVRIPAGQLLLGLYASVGRDPDQHGDTADTFNIVKHQLQDRRAHLAFGKGPHYCLGAPLARTEARLALPALLDRWPNLTLAVPADVLPQVPSMFSNCPKTVPVRPTPPRGC